MDRVLLISSHFPPENTAGVFRTLRFARYLPENGWDVHVLTIAPKYYAERTAVDPSLVQKVPREVRVHRTPAVYPVEWIWRMKRLVARGTGRRDGRGDRAAWSGPARDHEPRRGGVQDAGPGITDEDLRSGNGRDHKIIGLRQNPAPSYSWQGIKDAVTASLMTPDRYIGWCPFAQYAGRQVIRRYGIDVLYSSGPPWSNHLVGRSLKHSSGRPWVADFRDPWIGADFKPQRRSDSRLGRTHRNLERRVVEAADRIVVNTARSREDLLGRHPDLPREKFPVIPNGFDPADYVPFGDRRRSKQEFSQRPKLVLAHAGSFYGKRNVDGLLQALGRLLKDGSLPGDQVRLELIGAADDGRTAERDRIVHLDLGGVVTLTPRLSHFECLQRLSAADVLVLVQVGAPLSVPGKVYEYIALRKPLLALTGDGATRDLVTREQLGLCVDPDNVPGLVRAVGELYWRSVAGRPVARIPDKVRTRFDGRRHAGDLDEVLRAGLSAAGDPPASRDCQTSPSGAWR